MWTRHAIVRATVVAVSLQVFLRAASVAFPVMSAIATALSGGLAIALLLWLADKDESLQGNVKALFKRATHPCVPLGLGIASAALVVLVPVHVHCDATASVTVGAKVVPCRRGEQVTVWVWEHKEPPFWRVRFSAGDHETSRRAWPLTMTTVRFPDELVAAPEAKIYLSGDARFDLTVEAHPKSPYAVAVDGGDRLPVAAEELVVRGLWVGQQVDLEVFKNGTSCGHQPEQVSSGENKWPLETSLCKKP